VKWERHAEFSGYTIFAPGDSAEAFGELASAALPEGWLAAIPGKTIVAARAKLGKFAGQAADSDFVDAHFGGNVIVGAEIGAGAGFAFTDFQIDSDGFVRFLVLDRHFVPRQAGRMLQRLFDVESYRVMARRVAGRSSLRAPDPDYRGARVAPAQIARDDGDEALLDKLTGLAADVESAIVASFGSARVAPTTSFALPIAELGSIAPGQTSMNSWSAVSLRVLASRCRAFAGVDLAQASGLLSTRGNRPRKQNQSLLSRRWTGGRSCSSASDGRRSFGGSDHLLRRRAGRIPCERAEGERRPRRP
jgi:hypothetical protein